MTTLAAVGLGAAAATAQTPTQTEALTISLTVSPAVQTADFEERVTLAGEVRGGPQLAAALADRSFELEVDATALGYDRPLEIEPIVPKADGTFTRRLEAAVNSRIALKAVEGSAFTGQSPTVETHWKPLPEISNFPRPKRIVIEYRVTVPGSIPFRSGSLRIERGTATRAFFYAGSCGKLTPGGGCTKKRSRITRIGSAPLRSAFDGEVNARFSKPFSQLPKVPRGQGGRLYACLEGTAFKGTDPLDTKCGAKTTTGRIAPPE